VGVIQPNKWVVLALATAAPTVVNIVISAPAYMIPLWQKNGLSLSAGGALAGLTTFGMVLTLIGWGHFVDHRGERLTLTLGVGATAAAAFSAAWVFGTKQSFPVYWAGLTLLAAGAASASANAASGRLVVAAFPAEMRGKVMGIRQTAQPLGVGIAALLVPAVGESAAAVFLIAGAACAIVALLCVFFIADPELLRSDLAEHSANPYRGNSFLPRLHASSSLLVVPQALAWTFAATWLVLRHGHSLAYAGTIVAIAQLLGAGGRIVAGAYSDFLGSRMRPIRHIAVAVAVALASLALADYLDSGIAVILMVILSVLSVTDNGIAFTAIVEAAGPRYSGRALGIQNTAQLATMAAIGPVAGLIIGRAGYPCAFVVAGLAALSALVLLPKEPVTYSSGGWPTTGTSVPRRTAGSR
jgi:MFS family permease